MRARAGERYTFVGGNAQVGNYPVSNFTFFSQKSVLSLLADIFLSSYETCFLQSLHSVGKKRHLSSTL